MRIRPYTDDDDEPTLALWRTVSAATYTFLRPECAHTEAEDRAYFRDEIVAKHDLWLAVDERGLLGYLALRGSYIDRLYVGLERQREGIGTALLDHAKALSPEGLRLHTHQKNEGACRFYEARGFTPLEYGLSPPPESEPDVLYGWDPVQDQRSP